MMRWDGWMASPTLWTWVWPSSRSRWWKRSLACCSTWGCKELDMTELLNWTELNWMPWWRLPHGHIQIKLSPKAHTSYHHYIWGWSFNVWIRSRGHNSVHNTHRIMLSEVYVNLQVVCSWLIIGKMYLESNFKSDSPCQNPSSDRFFSQAPECKI